MNNQDLANTISGKNSKSGNKYNSTIVENAMYDAALRAANQKDEELKRHEQSLLWTVESILDTICVDSESYNNALNDFKSHLINSFD